MEVILLSVLKKIITKKLAVKLAVYLLEKLAAYTDNAVDDDLVKMVKEALDE